MTDAGPGSGQTPWLVEERMADSDRSALRAALGDLQEAYPVADDPRFLARVVTAGAVLPQSLRRTLCGVRSHQATDRWLLKATTRRSLAASDKRILRTF
jgi:hypothetical protein